MYRHILIPTDGSDLSNNAVRHGLALAKALNAKVTGITVTIPFHVFAVDPETVTDTPDSYGKRMSAAATKYLTQSERCRSGSRCYLRRDRGRA